MKDKEKKTRKQNTSATMSCEGNFNRIYVEADFKSLPCFTNSNCQASATRKLAAAATISQESKLTQKWDEVSEERKNQIKIAAQRKQNNGATLC